ncbi:hypothetical protein FRX31_034816, partial [Thalictrum thalictroides]
MALILSKTKVKHTNNLIKALVSTATSFRNGTKSTSASKTFSSECYASTSVQSFGNDMVPNQQLHIR